MYIELQLKILNMNFMAIEDNTKIQTTSASEALSGSFWERPLRLATGRIFPIPTRTGENPSFKNRPDSVPISKRFPETDPRWCLFRSATDLKSDSYKALYIL